MFNTIPSRTNYQFGRLSPAGLTPVIFLGPPASGKGTQAKNLSNALHVPAISTGELLRHDGCLSAEIQHRMQEGRLIPDSLINAMVADRIRRPDCAAGFILDGYPRDARQARYLAFILHSLHAQPPVVIHILLPDDIVKARMSVRLECPVCCYTTRLPESGQIPARCPFDGVVLVHRQDDSQDALPARLRSYHENIPDLLRFYSGERLFEVPGWDEAAILQESIRHFVCDPAYLI